MRFRGKDKAEAQKKAAHFVRDAAPELPLDRYPYELSGGQQQLTAILRAFFLRPALLLLDEPFGSLDRRVRRAARASLVRLWEEFRPTTIMVSHDPGDLLATCNRIILLGGRPVRVVTDIRSLPGGREEKERLHEELERALEHPPP